MNGDEDDGGDLIKTFMVKHAKMERNPNEKKKRKNQKIKNLLVIFKFFTLQIHFSLFLGKNL